MRKVSTIQAVRIELDEHGRLVTRQSIMDADVRIGCGMVKWSSETQSASVVARLMGLYVALHK